MNEAILKSSSQIDKEVRINKDKTLVYIDHYDEDDNLVAHFTMRRGNWESFIVSEMAELR